MVLESRAGSGVLEHGHDESHVDIATTFGGFADAGVNEPLLNEPKGGFGCLPNDLLQSFPVGRRHLGP